jgi:hypothetical protein
MVLDFRDLMTLAFTIGPDFGNLLTGTATCDLEKI